MKRLKNAFNSDVPLPCCLRQTYINKDNPTHKARFNGERLSTEIFKSIIDQSKDMGFIGHVNLQHYNEPLLDERLPELGVYAKDNLNCFLRCSTNMDLITKEKAKEIDGLFDGLQVSIYHGGKERPIIQIG